MEDVGLFYIGEQRKGEVGFTPTLQITPENVWNLKSLIDFNNPEKRYSIMTNNGNGFFVIGHGRIPALAHSLKINSTEDAIRLKILLSSTPLIWDNISRHLTNPEDGLN